MMHKAWSSVEEVPYCFSRSSVKFQGQTALKIAEFDPDWAFPDCNSSLNSPMATKWCTKLETAKERCPIVFQGHPSNFKVTRDKTSPILTQIGRFRTIGRSQLSNPSDLPCYRKKTSFVYIFFLTNMTDSIVLPEYNQYYMQFFVILRTSMLLINLLWHRDDILRHKSGFNIGSDNGVLPDGIKSLPGPMSTDHQRRFLAFNGEQFHKCSWT